MSPQQQLIETMLSKANIAIDGENPWDIKVNNQDLFERVVNQQGLGLGEAYMDGWWESKALDQFFYQLLVADLESELRQYILKHKEYFKVGLKWLYKHVQSRLFNYQSKKRAFVVGEEHYDAGNDLFKAMLDKEMNYTCAYWQGGAKTLEEAQIAKLELTCKKLQLKEGEKVLDIGCGWGAFARHAVKNYGVSVVGVTVSKEQKELAENLSKDLPIEYRLQDYRDINEAFDKIVSIGMFEHVGYKNYRTYMQVAKRSLKDNGLFLLHTIGSNTSDVKANEWISKYVFPNGMIPSVKQIGKSIEKVFVLEDWHNFGPDYDKTLMAWQNNFNQHWDSLKNNYSERFQRMWNYYLLSCAGAFRARHLQLWQIVLSKRGDVAEYKSIR